MSKDARKQPVLTDEAKKKFEECVSAMAVCGFGPDGPPVETTFAEIEEFGHEVGKMVARALDEKLTNQHAAHFQGTAPCPCCRTVCPVAEDPNTRDATGFEPVTFGSGGRRLARERRSKASIQIAIGTVLTTSLLNQLISPRFPQFTCFIMVYHQFSDTSLTCCRIRDAGTPGSRAYANLFLPGRHSAQQRATGVLAQ